MRSDGGFMRFFLVVFLVLPLALLWLGFSMINADPVMIDYYFGSQMAPLSLLLALSLGLGVLLGGITGITLFMNMRHEITQLRKQVKLREEEVMNLRAIPIRDVP